MQRKDALREKVFTPREALSQKPKKIDVPEGTELFLSPDEEEYKDSFSRIHIKSFEDLQLVGYVRRGLSGEKVLAAIQSDDAEAYKLAASQPQAAAHDCGCHGHAAQANTFASTFKRSYTNVRKRHNPMLSRVLSDHLGSQIGWDSAVASNVRKWSQYIEVNSIIVIAALFEDITINRNSTLRVDAAAKSLFAHNIWIHRTGRLVHEGSYLKIWANSLNRFSTAFVDIATLDVARLVLPTWKINA